MEVHVGEENTKRTVYVIWIEKLVSVSYMSEAF